MSKVVNLQLADSGLTPFVQETRNDESKQVIIMAARKLLECLRIIPAHYLWAQMNLQNAFSCCKKPENLTLEIRKTQESVAEPDLYIMQCACGRKHRRMLAEPGNYGLKG